MDELIMNELIELDIDNLQIEEDFLDQVVNERNEANSELDSHNDVDPDTMSLTISLA
ncbi:hypothetical protein [Portibacter lacus]|uniref:Uncharacterized protein n=1 Tax=Portibacter lacus TaxID=1099794 RepID=A0AA37SSF9_9BACT|nr:hypothetical protein [Portibacter lacus]GLR20206.1 hypothetical protein GCM10007940_48220 [Portibacter lacus]